METENPRIADGLGPAAESNEHDYAHTSDPPEPSVPPAEPPQLELPEPALGAEVDCPGGTEPEAGSAEEPVVTRVSPRVSKRPEDRNCCCCRLLFLRQGRSFNRRSVHTFTTPETVRWVFPDSVVHEKSFLCETCAQVIKSRAKRSQSGKRLMFVKPPETRKVKESGRRMGKKSKAALLVSKSSYKAAFRMLWSSKGARKPMMEFWSKQLRNEMKVLSRKPDSPFHQKVSGRKPLSSFPWRRCLGWARENAPLVTACLSSMFPDIKTLFKRSHNQLTEEQAVTLLERRTVVALSIPLFTRNIWTNNFLQAAVGGELRLQGCTGAALDLLNTMGLCQNKDTARLLVHRLRNGADMEGEQSLMLKHQQIKEDMGQTTTDEEEEEEEEEGDDDEEEEEGVVKQEDEMMMPEEVEVEEVQDGIKGDESDPPVMDKEERRRRKKAKKQRREEKRKERRGKRKEREEEEEDEDDELEQKRKVVVVRLGLLKGTSEVGRSDLSAP
ncbi:uncharacterized protein LOC110367140 isoform X2 [Fundulus heteroclitus]|uniref:uncharacterized protein LOC110367140 isoform X2 n=1 Tax=Fundulus heteroclitus TaxID=8078 RepID=UPI00165B7065|nr:uncharacterized protein LOC110367140 isoform X2 [Fundulus heteroclitus]